MTISVNLSLTYKAMSADANTRTGTEQGLTPKTDQTAGDTIPQPDSSSEAGYLGRHIPVRLC